MPLLISDANVLIDMEVGGLIERMFELPHDFATPDILYVDELEEHHSYLPELGLDLAALDSSGVERAMELERRHPKVSVNDCIALVLAQQLSCRLMTGDNALREVARLQEVVVVGTLWLVEEMLAQAIVCPDEAREAFEAMRSSGRRLPWAKAKKTVQAYR
jgi:predicted nucleic acid-binding protein